MIEAEIIEEEKCKKKFFEYTETENDINRRYAASKSEIMELQNKHQEKLIEAIREGNKPVMEALNEVKEAERKYVHTEALINKFEQEYQFEEFNQENTIAKIKNLQDEYIKGKSLKFVFKGETICSSCGQDIPENKINSVKAKQEEDFNKRQAEYLNKIVKEGNELKDLKSNRETKLNNIDKEIMRFRERLVAETEELEKARIKYSNLEKRKEVEYPGQTEALKQIEDLKNKIELKYQSELETLNNNKDMDIFSSNKDTYISIRNNFEIELEEINTKIVKAAANRKIDLRIEELLEAEREISIKVAELQKIEFLCDEFTRSKIRLIENRIKEKFKYISFKLFRTFIGSAGIEECCEITVNDVPYLNLNTASKVNAGLEIINVLCDHYNISAPIFIDNAESVVKYIETNSQLIKLYVDENCKELEVK